MIRVSSNPFHKTLCTPQAASRRDTHTHTLTFSARIHLPALPETERQYVLCYRAKFVLSGRNRISDAKPYLFSTPVVLPGCRSGGPAAERYAKTFMSRCRGLHDGSAFGLKVALVGRSFAEQVSAHPRLLLSQPGGDSLLLSLCVATLCRANLNKCFLFPMPSTILYISVV